jgi:hypothetical protein
MQLAPDYRYPWDSDKVRSEEPDDREEYFKGLVRALNLKYREISSVINNNAASGTPGAIAYLGL